MSDFPSLLSLIKFASQKYPSRVAFEIRRRIILEKVYYKDLPDLCSRISGLFESKGVLKGQKILFWGLNCPEYAVGLLTTMASGRVAVPVDYRTQDETLKKIIEQTKPVLLVVSKYLKSDEVNRFQNKLYIEDLFGQAQEISPNDFEEINSKDVCEIVYTSGTTGVPKGVMISPENILNNVAGIISIVPKLSAYRTVSVLPLSHMYEQIIGLFSAIALGTRVRYLTIVNSVQMINAWKEVKPTYLLLVPQVLSILWDKILNQAKKEYQDKKLLSFINVSSHLPVWIRRILFSKIHMLFGGKLEFVSCGGAPLNQRVADKFHAMGVGILQGYGATEVTAVATFNSNPWDSQTVGKAVNGVELKLDDLGQILVKSPCVSVGYFENPDKTAEVFKDGWYSTGDIGKLENGKLKIIGRDVFKIVLSSGEKVYVEDLEVKINRHPLVKDACVVAKSVNNADVIHAVILLREDNNLDSVIKQINETLESKQQITSYSLWKDADFPRTPTLKIDRRLVKKVIDQGSNSAESVGVTATAAGDLFGVIAKVSGVDRVKINDNDLLTSDLGMDSVSRSELVASIEEELGVEIDQLAVNSKTTVADIREMVKKAEGVSGTVEYSSWQFTWWGEILRTAFYKLGFFLHSLGAKLEIEGDVSVLKPGRIIIFNHAGIFDGVCVFRLLGDKANKVVTASWSGFWEQKIFSKFLELSIGGLPLNQQGKDVVPLMRKISDLIDEGRFLLFAPQGRMQQSGQNDPFKVGIGMFAHELKREVVPVKIIDYEKIWPTPPGWPKGVTIKDYFPKKSGVVKIKIGVPIDHKNLQTPIEVANLIEERFNSL